MTSQEDRVFAKIAVQNKLLPQGTVDKCLEALDKAVAEGKKITLSDILTHNKLLTNEQVSAVKQAAQFSIMRGRDKTYCRVLLEKGLAEQADLDDAAVMQQQFFTQKRLSVSILDVLSNKGVVTKEAAALVIEKAGAPSAAPSAPVPAAAAPKSRSAKRATVEKAGKCKVAIKVRTLGSGREVTTMKVSGALDADSFNELQKIIEKVLARDGDEGKYLVLNLDGVGYMSSAGVGVIISANREAENKGGVFKLANLTREVKEVMGLVGLDEVLGDHTMDEALKIIEKAV